MPMRKTMIYKYVSRDKLLEAKKFWIWNVRLRSYLKWMKFGVALLEKSCHSIHRSTANLCEQDKAGAFVVLPCRTP